MTAGRGAEDSSGFEDEHGVGVAATIKGESPGYRKRAVGGVVNTRRFGEAAWRGRWRETVGR